MFPRKSSGSFSPVRDNDDINIEGEEQQTVELEARAAEVVSAGFLSDPMLSGFTKKDGDSGFISPDVAPSSLLACGAQPDTDTDTLNCEDNAYTGKETNVNEMTEDKEGPQNKPD